MEPEEWYWEGHIQDRVAEQLRAEGWTVLSSADTLSRETGIDLVLERDGQRLNIEVKGWPSKTYRRGPKAGLPKPTNPTLQARHWYAGALLTTALLRDADPHARVALAFPDFSRYRDLLRRTAGSLAALRVEALLIAEPGDVSWIDPLHLPPSTRDRGGRRETLARGDDGPSTKRPAASMTLHEAMASVLRQAPSGRLTARELADEINQRDLYRMRDGRPVAPGQIHARARNYGHLFAIASRLVSLRR